MVVVAAAVRVECIIILFVLKFINSMDVYVFFALFFSFHK